MYEIESQVLTPDAPHATSPAHRVNGQFAKGNQLGGRARRAEETAIIAAMNQALPAEELQQLLTEAIGWAREYKSPKLVLAIAQFVVSYQIGAPVQRSITASTKLDTFLDAVRGLSDDEFSQVVESTYNS